jgi:tripartite-type tricarboxylate transporter receptor subunit TctC
MTHPSRFRRAALCIALAAAAAVLVTPNALAQAFPNKAVKLVIPLTAGSGADIAARILAKSLTDIWKQPVVIENRPGAGGLVGTGVVAQAPADGYTLMVQSASYSANPALYKKLPYDVNKPLVDVGFVGMTPYVMVTAANGPYQSVRDLVNDTKAKPGGVAFASAGQGSSTHLAAEHFNQTSGIQMLHIPYQGSPQAMQDTIAGRTAFYMAPLDASIGHVKGGRLKALGVTTSARAEAASDIPTLAEQGMAGFDLSLWFGLWAPPDTPAALTQQINADLNKALSDPEVMAAFAKGGIAIKKQTPAEFSAFVKDEVVKFTKIARDAKLEPQ